MLLTCFACLIAIGCNGDDPKTFRAAGIVEGTDVKVSALTGGLLLSVNVDEGDDVSAGSVIAVVDSEKLSYQREVLQAGLREIEIQRRMSTNTLSKAETDFNYVEKKYRRFEKLYKKNSASEQVLDDWRRNYDAAGTQLENARQALSIVESKKTALQAQLKTLERQLADATIEAPLSGTVTTKFFEAGETVATGFPVIEIIDLSKMWTKVYVSELLLPRIAVGQPATVRIDGTETTLTGRIAWISTKAEFTPKNILTDEARTSLVYAIKVTIDNPDRILKHGMPVVVELDLESSM